MANRSDESPACTLPPVPRSRPDGPIVIDDYGDEICECTREQERSSFHSQE